MQNWQASLQFTYEPFGRTTFSGAGTSNLYRFTGRELDATGLYFLRARYYNPVLQRFLSPDPIGFNGGSPNLYAYANNSPTTFIDPLGLIGGASGCGGSGGGSGIPPGSAWPWVYDYRSGRWRARVGEQPVVFILFPPSIGPFAFSPGIGGSGAGLLGIGDIGGGPELPSGPMIVPFPPGEPGFMIERHPNQPPAQQQIIIPPEELDIYGIFGALGAYAGGFPGLVAGLGLAATVDYFGSTQQAPTP